jgi:hypothetical protein
MRVSVIGSGMDLTVSSLKNESIPAKSRAGSEFQPDIAETMKFENTFEAKYEPG